MRIVVLRKIEWHQTDREFQRALVEYKRGHYLHTPETIMGSLDGSSYLYTHLWISVFGVVYTHIYKVVAINSRTLLWYERFVWVGGCHTLQEERPLGRITVNNSFFSGHFFRFGFPSFKFTTKINVSLTLAKFIYRYCSTFCR